MDIKIILLILFGVLFFIGFICILVFVKNASDNFFCSLMSLIALILFISSVNNLYKIINSTMRIDDDVIENKEIILYKYLPILLYAIISFTEIVVLYILYLKTGFKKDPTLWFNFIVKVICIFAILHIMIYLTKRGFYITTWVVGFIPIIVMILILLYTIS
jgi:hypothetical protein